MGFVNSALQIGRSALATYQSALQVIGNNVSNAGNRVSSRMRVGFQYAPLGVTSVHSSCKIFAK